MQFLQQINAKKCPFSIWHRDFNPQPLEHKSSPIITRPGLPPSSLDYLLTKPSGEKVDGKADFNTKIQLFTPTYDTHNIWSFILKAELNEKLTLT